MATIPKKRYAGDCRADQGARDASGRGPRENGDDRQNDEIQAAKEIELLLSHCRFISRASDACKRPQVPLNAEYTREKVLIPSLRWPGLHSGVCREPSLRTLAGFLPKPLICTDQPFAPPL